MSAVPKSQSERARAVRQEQLLAVLDPIARLARHAGLTSNEFMSLVRESMLAATKAPESEESTASITRMALQSGLTRSEVGSVLSLREDREQKVLADRQIKQVADRVATAWMSDPRYSAPYGCAMTLPVRRDALSSGGSKDKFSFTDLVIGVTPNADVEVVLQTLIDAGTVSWTSEAQTHVSLSPEFVSVLEQGDDTTFWYVTSTIAGVARTLVTNAYELYPGPKLFERRAVADRLVDEPGLAAVTERMRGRLSSALESMTADLNRHEVDVEDEVASTGGLRASIGLYVMAEATDRPLPKAPGAKKRTIRTIDLASPTASSDDD
jgi:hypothetical protein